jgi:site-specific DNA recombinase
MRAGLYARISQDRNDEGLGVERQERDARKLAERKGWEVADVYVDNDLSAYTGKRRPEFERLLADVKAKRIRAVVAYHPDRLYRHPRDLEAFVETIEAAGAKVATVAAGEFDLATASGRMVARMLGAAARGESERASERIRRQRLSQVEAGRRQGGGRRPFGYTADMKVDRAEAVLIREAVEQLLAGASLYRVAQDWNERGVTTPGGHRWRGANLRRMVVRPLLAGLRVHGPTGTVTSGSWTPIVTEDEHRLLVARFPEGVHGRGKGERTTRRRALLSGLVCCSECGRRLLWSAGRYVCDRGRSGGCGRVRVNDGRALERAVLQITEERAAARKRDRGRSAKREDAERESLLAELRGLDERLAMLTEMLAAGEMDRGAYTSARTKVVAQRSEVEESLRDLGGLTDEQATQVWESVEAWLNGDALSPAQIATLQQGIVDAFGQCIRVKPGAPREPFDSARIETKERTA